MALDNWGTVDRWFAADKVTTFGPSGIGFVNFGLTREITLQAPIETLGGGARVLTSTRGPLERLSLTELSLTAMER
jgi:hypothetical protein